MSASRLGLSQTIVRAASLHVSKPTWWLTSRFHFSFADYHDPERNNFGVLRVINDDIVEAGGGFGLHPHRSIEIFSYGVEGELTHGDSLGNSQTVTRGDVQFMSVGSRGVYHSEMNEGDTACRFLQIWVLQNDRPTHTQYGQAEYTLEDRHNKFLHVIGGTTKGGLASDLQDNAQQVSLNQDVNVVVSELDVDAALELPVHPRRQLYVVCIEGALTVGGVAMGKRDGLKVRPAATTQDDEETVEMLRFQAVAAEDDDGPNEGRAHFLVLEMASS